VREDAKRPEKPEKSGGFHPSLARHAVEVQKVRKFLVAERCLFLLTRLIEQVYSTAARL
jgi:hypothetical protein